MIGLVESLVMSPKTLDELCQFFSYTSKRRMLDSFETAQMIGIEENTLRLNRVKGVGPPFIKGPGMRLVRYSEMDVLSWLFENRRQSTSDTKPAA